jgi:hypothetical protein
VTGDPAASTESGIQSVFDSAATSLAAFPAASPATRTEQWWAPLDCADLLAHLDPGAYGFERVALLDQDAPSIGPGSSPDTIADVARSSCDLHFTAGSGENTSGEVVTVSIVPGGAVAFRTAAEAEYASAFSVTGAAGAVVVPGLDRYEGSAAVIVATDGTNVMMVTPDLARDTSAARPIADAAFALMSP